VFLLIERVLFRLHYRREDTLEFCVPWYRSRGFLLDSLTIWIVLEHLLQICQVLHEIRIWWELGLLLRIIRAFPLKTVQYILGIVNDPDFGHFRFSLLSRLSIWLLGQRAIPDFMKFQSPHSHRFSTLTISKILWRLNYLRDFRNTLIFLRFINLVFFSWDFERNPSFSSLKLSYSHFSQLGS
jgi:hypothetical protein